MPKILMTVPLDGISTGSRNLSVVTEGFQGAACQDATATLKRALGEVREEQLTPEYYATPNDAHVAQQL